jgi:hypothetical protein
MTFLVEMVVNRGMHGGEFLQPLYVSEPGACALPHAIQGNTLAARRNVVDYAQLAL